jgi:hypothetical protein
MAMVERVYRHFRNQSYQARLGLTGRGRNEGFEPTCVSGLVLSWIVVGGYHLDSLPMPEPAGERTISLDLGGRLCSFARSPWGDLCLLARPDRQPEARGL